MTRKESIILTRKQVADLLHVTECIDAMENVFRLYGKGQAQKPGILGIPAHGGGFHIKAGMLDMGRNYFVAKINGNFPDNPKRSGLPTIQGLIAVFDADTGKPLALLDSIHISILRTGSATAVAARYLAPRSTSVLTICGCGNQGRISLLCLSEIFKFTKIFVYDINEQTARTFATQMASEVGTPVEYVSDLSHATFQSDICITCTPSKKPYLQKKDISPGTFIAAVGSDNEDKQELDADLITSSLLVTDVTDQCASIGELHHAIDQGLMRKEQVYAELGEIISGKRPGRQNDEDVIIFDSTGMALQDAAAAAIVYEKALQTNTGIPIALNQ